MAEPPYARPAAELVTAQRRGKEQWHRQQAHLPLPDKIRLLLDLQRKLYPILRQRRPLQPWERPWDIDA